MLRRVFKSPIVVLMIGWSLSAAAEAPAVAKQTPKLFYALKAPVQQTVLFRRMSDGRELYASSPDTTVSPASVTKLVTSAAVLAKWSPAHTFKTRFFHTGSRKNGIISGNLIVVGDGDPMIINEKLWQLAADLRLLGVRAITGDIVIDNSLFDGDDRDDTRLAGLKRSSNAYDAPVSAFGVNFNTFAVAMAPGGDVGALAIADQDPYRIRGVNIVNQLRTTASRRGSSIKVSRLSANGHDSSLVVKGGIGMGAGLQKVYRSVPDHAQAAGEQLRAFLLKEGIQVKGGVREGRVDSRAHLLHTMESFELSRAVMGLNKYSNNYIADVLIKRLGAAFAPSGVPDAPGQGTMANGVRVLNEFLAKDVKVQGPFAIYNGSGLDPRNRLSARQIVDLLSFMERRFDLFPEFLASLPAAGWDGTLATRFDKAKTKALEGLVRAKTGTLTEPLTVSGLAGYIRHPKHGLVAFAIIENGMPGEPQPSPFDLRERQDQALIRFLETL